MADEPIQSPAPSASPASSSAPAAPSPQATPSAAPAVADKSTTAPAEAVQPDPAQSAAPASNRPTWANDKIWDGEKNTWSEDWIRDTVTNQAAEEARKLTLPKSETDYKVELPKDFQAPEGVDVKFREDDPLIAAAKKQALAMGLSQDQFSSLLGLYAGSKAGEAQQLSTLRQAEVGKLGAAGPQRVDAVVTWLKGIGGEKFSGLANALEHAPLASTVEGFEHLMRTWTSQGGSTFSASGRDQNVSEPGKIPGFEKMTFEQRRMAQYEQTANQRRGAAAR